MKLLIPLIFTIVLIALVSPALAPKVTAKPLAKISSHQVEISDLEHRIAVYREDNERLRGALRDQLNRYESVAAELMLARKQLNGRGEPQAEGLPIYWLTTSSDTRHNCGCRWFEKTKGRFCTENEGLPCISCGG
ncbi:MAG: hypothetical protein AAGH89_07530 [Verrucomicrobiota bacterium]